MIARELVTAPAANMSEASLTASAKHSKKCYTSDSISYPTVGDTYPSRSVTNAPKLAHTAVFSTKTHKNMNRHTHACVSCCIHESCI